MTDVLASLWLPVLLSAVVVFLLSSVLHMALPWHRDDYRRMPNEDAVMDALRPIAPPPGDYMVPRPRNMDDLRSAAFKDKMAKGPVMIATVLPTGGTGMGRNLMLWFVYLVIVAALTALVAALALPRGAGHYQVTHVTLVTAFMGYCLALWQMTIWYRRSWAATLRSTVDGFLYALATGLLFAWFWPR